MTTDHQPDEPEPPVGERAWGVIAAAMLAVAILLASAVLMTR